MPLIECPDCKRQVSDLAPSCPGCGRPKKASRPIGPTIGDTAKSVWKIPLILLFAVPAGLIAVPVLVFWARTGPEYESRLIWALLGLSLFLVISWLARRKP